MQFLSILFIIFILISCESVKIDSEDKVLIADSAKVDDHKNLSRAPKKILKTNLGTEIPLFSFEAFYPYVLERKEEDINYVVNFWATWCGPCVAELPYFFELEKKYADKKVKFVYVSLDFLENLKNKLIPFIENRKIFNEIVVLDQKNADEWMDMINKNWSGSIPATLIYNTRKRKFMETSFESVAELEKLLNEF